MNIKDYVEQSKNKENQSDGGSKCYFFDDVVLVKYEIQKKYGKARPREEVVASLANKKNEMGINTPKHLEILREQTDTKDICWVLQERCPGVSLKKFYEAKTPEQIIEIQKKVLKIPQKHLDKMIFDICALKELGLELKPKNIYYDSDLENGGFYIIDLLGGQKPFEPSIKNCIALKNSVFAFCGPVVSSWDDNATKEQKEESRKLYYAAQAKIFKTMQNSVPNFKEYERYVLRDCDKDTLDYFKEQGVFDGDLTLNDEEISTFDGRCLMIAEQCAELVVNGKETQKHVESCEIGNYIGAEYLSSDFQYHPDCPKQKPQDVPEIDEYGEPFDLRFYQKEMLESKIQKEFKAVLPPQNESKKEATF